MGKRNINIGIKEKSVLDDLSNHGHLRNEKNNLFVHTGNRLNILNPDDLTYTNNSLLHVDLRRRNAHYPVFPG